MSDVNSIRGLDPGVLPSMQGTSAPRDTRPVPEAEMEPLDFKHADLAEKVLSTRQPVREEDLSPALMDELLTRVNDVLDAMGTRLKFERGESSRSIIKVLDDEGNVLKTIPPEKMVEAARKLREFQNTIGLMIDVER